MKTNTGYWLLIFFSFVFPLTVQAADSWIEIGRGKAPVAAKKTTFSVSEQKNYDQIRFQVNNGSIQLDNAKIHMHSGRIILLSIQKRIQNGLFSKIYPLTNVEQRSIKKIELFYRKVEKLNPEKEISIILQGIQSPD